MPEVVVFPLDFIPKISPMLRPVCRCVCGGAIVKCYSGDGLYWVFRHVARNFPAGEFGAEPPAYCFLWDTWEVFGKLKSVWVSRVRIPLHRLVARLQPKKYPHRCFHCGRQALTKPYDYDGAHWPAHCFRDDCLDEWGPK